MHLRTLKAVSHEVEFFCRVCVYCLHADISSLAAYTICTFLYFFFPCLDFYETVKKSHFRFFYTFSSHSLAKAHQISSSIAMGAFMFITSGVLTSTWVNTYLVSSHVFVTSLDTEALTETINSVFILYSMLPLTGRNVYFKSQKQKLM